MEISVDRFETYADGLDHPEDLAFDAEGVLWAGGELGQIYRIPEKGRVEEVVNIGGFCLGLTFSAPRTNCSFAMRNILVLRECRKTATRACLPISPAITN